MRTIKVAWLDAFSGVGWMGLEEAESQKPSVIDTTGYEITNNELRVTIARDIGNGLVGAPITIPAQAIISVEVICEDN